jgi:hypothetical protein
MSMAKKPVLHLKKGRTWLLNRGGMMKRRGSTVLVPDQYRSETPGSAAAVNAETGGLHYGIVFHPAPLEIADPLGHYFLPVEKAA